MTSKELIELIIEAKAKKARRLSLRKKKLTVLPLELFMLTDLIALDLSCNDLTVLPSEIAQCSKLKYLNLCSNQFTSLPPELFQLQGLLALGLSDLELTTLPAEISQLKNLSVLYLHHNCLTSLPPELFQLNNLEELILWENQLTSLSPDICKLSKLKYIDLKENPITSPPQKVIQGGLEAIRLYFSFQKSPTQPLNEVKAIFIGDRATGKTSLVKQLLDEPFDRHEGATRGINLQTWETDACTESGGRRMKINMWDFGGTETLHASHQLFLSKRSLYILVLDRTVDERIEYWLQHIKTFGGNSPVLIVLNKQDANSGFTVNQSFLREKHHNIRDFFHTSCKTGVGIATFKQMLLAELAKAEMIAIRWTEPWFAVKLRVKQIQWPYLGCKKYFAVCREERMNNEKTCEMLVRFLHDLGAVVHFNDLIVDDMYVVDPMWAINAVYMIVAAPELVARRGILQADSFFKILWQNDIEQKFCMQDTHPYIISLMQQLELCCELEGGAVLIPQLLPVSEPKFSFKQRNSLQFTLYYPNFLPPSVFPSFIVKAHQDITQRTCWRTGVLLRDSRTGAEALIKQDTKARQINLWLQGERSREYLHYLRYLLAVINSRFENLNVMERLPVPENQDISADYATLLAYTKNGMDKYIPSGSAKVYSVHELLSTVQPHDKDELLNMLQKIDKKLHNNGPIAEVIKTMFELNPNTAGGLNMNNLFAQIMARLRQQSQQSKGTD